MFDRMTLEMANIQYEAKPDQRTTWEGHRCTVWVYQQYNKGKGKRGTSSEAPGDIWNPIGLGYYCLYW